MEGTAEKKLNVKKVCIIAGILIVAIGLTVGLIIFFSPINIIKRAIQSKDIKTIAENYEKLDSVSDRELVKDTMYDYVYDLSQKYIDKEIDYETLDTNIQLLNNILQTNDDYAVLVAYAEMLHESRENSRMGDEQMASGNYYEAIEYYTKVNILDPDFEDSVSSCNACVEKLLVGEWKVSGSLENIITSEDIVLYDVSYPIFLYLVFEEGNTGYIQINKGSVIGGYEVFVESAADDLYWYLISKGYTDAQIDYLLDQNYCEDMVDLVEMTYDEDVYLQIPDSVSKNSVFEYYIDGNTLVIEYSSMTVKYTYVIDYDDALLKLYSPSTSEYLTILDVSFPAIFEKAE